MGSSRSRHSTRAVKSRPAKTSSPSKSPDSSQTELCRELSSIAIKLRGVYSVGVTLRLALEGQGDEHDADIAYCLGWNILDPVADQLRRLSKIVVGLGGDEVTLL